MRILFILTLAAGIASVRAPIAETAEAAVPAFEPQTAEEATLTGRVKMKGEIPKRKKIVTNADPKCAAAHGGNLQSDDFVIDAAGNIQWALVFVKSGLGDQKFPVPKAPAVIEQKGCRFEPHTLGVMVGQELMFRNMDPLMHIVHVIPSANKEFGFSQAKMGEERAKVFAFPEVIRLICDVHPWMVAWIHVLEHPFYAATGPDGKFKIKGLPPGKYTIEAWHEGYKSVTEDIEVKAKDNKTVNFELTERKER
jgi:plastocyanin